MPAVSYLNHFASWVDANEVELARCGAHAFRLSGQDRGKPSAHLSLETSAAFVELIVWESGEAEFAFGPFQKAVDEHHELSGMPDFDALLGRFLERAKTLSSP